MKVTIKKNSVLYYFKQLNEVVVLTFHSSFCLQSECCFNYYFLFVNCVCMCLHKILNGLDLLSDVTIEKHPLLWIKIRHYLFGHEIKEH